MALTGPFNNQNYAGAWLSLVWPFSLAFLIEKTNSSFKKIQRYFLFFKYWISLNTYKLKKCLVKCFTFFTSNTSN